MRSQVQEGRQNRGALPRYPPRRRKAVRCQLRPWISIGVCGWQRTSHQGVSLATHAWRMQSTEQWLIGDRWDDNLLDMCIGEKRTLTIPPEFGYGDRNMGPIPAGSTLSAYLSVLQPRIRCANTHIQSSRPSSSVSLASQSQRRSLRRLPALLPPPLPKRPLPLQQKLLLVLKRQSQVSLQMPPRLRRLSFPILMEMDRSTTSCK